MKEKKSSIGCLFWIALILLILVIFLFNRSTIESVLDNTQFLDLFSEEDVEPDVERIEDVPSRQESEEDETVQNETEPPVLESESVPGEELESVELSSPEIETETLPATPEESPASDPQIRKSRLYFVKVDNEGKISLKGIIRPVYYTDSPLTETLTNLLKGLSSSEINQGLLSLIPDGTIMLSVLVKDSTAYLNFTDNFLFNSFGVEGYTAQLQQIVYTALEFTTVDRVQILINGDKMDYMGIEGGPYIGEPLTRESF